MKILVNTLFDCTTTAVVGRYREERGEYQDQSGQWIRSYADWERSRNQQRNYETLLQVMSLRTQLLEVNPAVRTDLHWQFAVDTERDDAYGMDFQALLDDCANVPMLTGLLEQRKLPDHLVPQGTDRNLWFQLIE